MTNFIKNNTAKDIKNSDVENIIELTTEFFENYKKRFPKANSETTEHFVVSFLSNCVNIIDGLNNFHKNTPSLLMEKSLKEIAPWWKANAIGPPCLTLDAVTHFIQESEDNFVTKAIKVQNFNQVFKQLISIVENTMNSVTKEQRLQAISMSKVLCHYFQENCLSWVSYARATSLAMSPNEGALIYDSVIDKFKNPLLYYHAAEMYFQNKQHEKARDCIQKGKKLSMNSKDGKVLGSKFKELIKQHFG